MRYLADTNVISDARRNEGPARSWVVSVDQAEVALSVVVIAELERGVFLSARRHPEAAASLRGWLRGVRAAYRDRILPVTEPIAAQWGELCAQRPRPILDTFLAATALVHDLVVVTRNVRDFEGTGVRLLNPWSGG